MTGLQKVINLKPSRQDVKKLKSGSRKLRENSMQQTKNQTSFKKSWRLCVFALKISLFAVDSFD
jgi:hypothetical protein